MSVAATSQFQWILSLVIPLAKISSTWVAQKTIKKIPETNNEDVELLVTAELTKIYTSYVTGRLASLNQSSVYGILVMEVIFYLFTRFQGIKLRTRVAEGYDSTGESLVVVEMKKKVQTLTIIVFTDTIMPLAYGFALWS